MRSSKRCKAEESDRMSSLPDHLLLHILSFVPTKTCVPTSRLSRRWRHVWENLQVLDFDDDDIENQFNSFAGFVNTVVLRKFRHIRKLRLSCVHSPFNAMWVCAAIGPLLEELSLSLGFGFRDAPGFVIPPTLLTCTNLVSLSITGEISLHVRHASAVCLPSLKTLKLDIKGFVDSVDLLLSGCPILETLDLSFCGPCNTTTTRVCVPPSVKRFNFVDSYKVVTHLEIDAPELKCLSIAQNAYCFPYSVGNLQNVVNVSLDVLPNNESVNTLPLLELLQALTGTKYLVLHRLTIEWLLGGSMLDFPDFGCLLRLELNLPEYCNPIFLLNMLERCHMLQELIIFNCQTRSPLLSWVQPTSVPNCLKSHLSSVHFKGYAGCADEIAFTAYILQEGLVLKTVIFDDILLPQFADILLPPEKKCELLSMPKGSNKCQLKFVSSAM